MELEIDGAWICEVFLKFIITGKETLNFLVI